MPVYVCFITCAAGIITVEPHFNGVEMTFIERERMQRIACDVVGSMLVQLSHGIAPQQRLAMRWENGGITLEEAKG